MTIQQQIQYRAKAILAGIGVTVVGLAEWLVSNPDTAKAIEHIVPAPYTQLVPIILSGVAVALVHHFPNVTPAAAVAPVEPTTDTTVLRLNSVNSGEFIGDPAH